jgi:hypothetical protein
MEGYDLALVRTESATCNVSPFNSDDCIRFVVTNVHPHEQPKSSYHGVAESAGH